MTHIRVSAPSLSSNGTQEDASTSCQQRKRGPSRALATISQSLEKRMKVRQNVQGQPIGNEAQKLSSFIGTIARHPQKTPLTYFTFKDLPEIYKESCWKRVKEWYDVESSLERWVMFEYAKLWRSWRCALRRIYEMYDNLQDRLHKRPQFIPPNQWETLMKYYDTDKSKALSEKNKRSRAKQKYMHNTGTKSFARFREEIVPNGDSDPTRAQFWIRTHTSSNPNFFNAETHAMLNKITKMISGPQEGQSDPRSRTDILSKALGEDKYGRVRTYGIGVKSSEMFGQMPTRLELLTQNDALHTKVNGLEDKVSSLQSVIHSLNEKIERLTSIEVSLH